MASRKESDKSKNLPWGLTPEGLTPGSMKTISENKLKAFSVGLMNAGLKKTSKVKQDLQIKKKKEEAECAEVFADFVASFQDNKTSVKTFVKGNTFNPETKEETAAEKGKLYKPSLKFQPTAAEEKPRVDLTPKKPDLKKKSKEKEKKKSNLELFKEELKRQQEERELRHKIKRGELTDIPKDVLANFPASLLDPQKDDSPFSSSYGSHDTGDPSTTNLYIGNINPKMNEEMLMKLFGKFGPLASVKIMWPRTEEEKARNRNCGFVAYMRRKDGQKALDALKGKEIMEFEMKLGWGKSVPIPPHPIYVPPEMQEQNVPPPPSGLPFNAQPRKGVSQDSKGGQQEGVLDPNGFHKETLANAVVKVVIPTERNLLMLIHRMIEFVVREGPMFEAMIMNKEINNPMYRFLFDNQSPEHIYYRWRIFSILQGDSPQKWKTEKFRMFVDGSMWSPPPCHQYGPAGIAPASSASVSVPAPKPQAEIVKPAPQPAVTNSALPSSGTSSSSNRKSTLSARQRDKLEDLLRELTPERSRISDCMVWCVDHADSAEEIVECIAESLSILETPLQSKVARLYVVSDVLYNCTVKVPNVSYYRRGFEGKLVEIFKNLQLAYSAIVARMKAENFRKQVMRCLSAWMDWAVYPPGFIVNLQGIFLGQAEVGDQLEAAEYFAKPDKSLDQKPKGDVDGAPLSLDGVPLPTGDLDGIPMRGGNDFDGVPIKGQEDFDGIPFDGIPLKTAGSHFDGVPLRDGDLDGAPMDLDGVPMENKSREGSHKKELPLIASKWDHPEWESVEESEEKQRSASKELSPEVEATVSHESARAGVGGEIDESRRKKLREIELKVAEYAEKLEAKGGGKKGINIVEKCNQYRAKLLESIDPTSTKESKSKKKKSKDALSPDSSSRKRSRSRSRSPKRHRSRRRSESPNSSGSRSRSKSPLAVSLQSLKSYESRTPSPSRSRSPSPRNRKKSRSRSPSKSPKRKHRSRSSSPSRKSSRKRHSRSRSRSPTRKKSKKRKK